MGMTQQAHERERDQMPYPVRLYLMRVGEMPAYQIPIVCYLVQLNDGTNVLIDSGLPEVLPADEKDFVNTRDVVTQLREIDVRPEDINIVISTHYDIDHAGHHSDFTQARYVVQRSHHHDAASNPRFAPLRSQWDQDPSRILLVDGDVTLFDGLQLLLTSGHVPGHQSVLVQLPQTGAVLLPIDAVPFGGGFVRDAEFDLSAPDAKETQASLYKLLDIVDTHDIAMVVFGHDEAQWQVLKTLPEYYS